MAEVLTRIVPEDGVRQVYNGTGGALVEGTLVKLKASPTYKGEIELSDDNKDPTYGVLMEDVSDASRGNCQIAGRALVLAGGTIAVGARVMPTTAGKSLTGTAGNAIAGVAVTAGTASALHEVELSGSFGGEMPG